MLYSHAGRAGFALALAVGLTAAALAADNPWQDDPGTPYWTAPSNGSLGTPLSGQDVKLTTGTVVFTVNGGNTVVGTLIR
jgi:hypothetical protein